MAAEAGFDISLRADRVRRACRRRRRRATSTSNQIGWSGRVDPDGNIHQFVTCKGGLNDGRYCNPEVDRLLNEARVINDEAKRKQLYDAAQAILQEELPIIYLYYQTVALRARPRRSQGFKPYPDGMIRLKGVKLAS